MLKEYRIPRIRFLQTYLWSYILRERLILKKKIARTHENITFCNTISSGFAKPQEHTDGEMTP